MMRRWKILPTNADIMLNALCRDDRKHPAFIICEGIPDDARVVNLQYNAFTGQVEMVIESDEFAEVPDGDMLTRFHPSLTAYQSREQYESAMDPASDTEPLKPRGGFF